MESIDRLVAESQIRALLARTAWVGDSGTTAEYADCYAADATWCAGQARDEGLEAIIASAEVRRAAGRTGPGTATRHLVNVMSVEVVDQAHAHTITYFTFYTGVDYAPAVAAMGVYRDHVVLTEEGWRIAERVVTND